MRSDGHADLLQQEKSKISMESNLELFRYILSSSGAIFVIMVSKEELRERPLIYLCLKHCSQYFTTTILFNTLKLRQVAPISGTLAFVNEPFTIMTPHESLKGLLHV